MEKKELMKDDYLKTIKFISSDIFHKKSVKIIYGIIFGTHLTATIITTYYFMFHLNGKTIMKYLSVYISPLYGMSAIAVIYMTDVIQDLDKELELWSLKHADSKTYKKIQKEIKFTSFYGILCCVSGTVAGAYTSYNLCNDSEIFFMVHFFAEKFPSKFLMIFYKATFIALSYAMIEPTNMVVYYCQHTNFQLCMFNQYLKSVGKNDRQSQDFLQDEVYQKESKANESPKTKVYDFFRILLRKTNQLSRFIALMSIMGCLVGVGFVSYFLSVNHIPTQYYGRMAILFFTAFITSLGLFWSAQQLENNFQNQFYALCEVPWYNFNSKNKITYLIILPNLQKGRQLKFSDSLALNYQLGLRVVRGMYSILSVFAQIRN